MTFDDLVSNALDFFSQSVEDFKQRPKSAVLNLAIAVELFLKARLFSDHWTLILEDPRAANLRLLQSGDFVSVSIKKAIRRLNDVLDIRLTESEKGCFEAISDYRNQLIHSHLPRFTRLENGMIAAEEIVAEQCKAWHFLYVLLTQRWESTFNPYRSDIEHLNQQLQTHREFLSNKFELLKPDLARERENGRKIVACPLCRFESNRLTQIFNLIHDGACAVCQAQRRFISATCPHCDTETWVAGADDLCRKCGASIEVQTLIAQYHVAQSPKSEAIEPSIAFCGLCGTGEPTAIELGDHWVCLNCLAIPGTAENCEWCGALTAGLRENSYLEGCEICDGRLGHRDD
jgi:hypothetical protein